MTRSTQLRTFADYQAFLGSRVVRQVSGIRATFVRLNQDGSIGVTYHSTEVVTAHQDGTFTLNSGGFHTLTTKVRMAQFSPAQVYSKNFKWFVANGTNPPVPFYDGIRVNSYGWVIE